MLQLTSVLHSDEDWSGSYCNLTQNELLIEIHVIINNFFGKRIHAILIGMQMDIRVSEYLNYLLIKNQLKIYFRFQFIDGSFPKPNLDLNC